MVCLELVEISVTFALEATRLHSMTNGLLRRCFNSKSSLILPCCCQVHLGEVLLKVIWPSPWLWSKQPVVQRGSPLVLFQCVWRSFMHCRRAFYYCLGYLWAAFEGYLVIYGQFSVQSQAFQHVLGNFWPNMRLLAIS